MDDDLEWKVLYVGSAQDATRDQVLDEILVGPVPVGVNKFVLQADAPDPAKLPPEDLLGVTVVLVTCSYKEREFVRVGYYVNNEYHDPNAPPPIINADGQQEQPPLPKPIPIEHIQRQILADKPRVTKFPISWGEEPNPTTNNDNNNSNNNMMDTTNMENSMQQPYQSSNPMQQTPSGIVSMQEESNLEPFSHHQGVQAMME